MGNLIGSKGSGFEVDTNQATLYFKAGGKESLNMMSKADLANRILDHIAMAG